MLRGAVVSLALTISCLATAPATAEDLIGLYLTWRHDPTTTMTVNWVDIYEGSSATVNYRAAGQGAWEQATADRSTVGPTTLQLRRAELTGLEPGTLYEFCIGEPNDADHILQFKTMPAALDEPISFVAGGDMMHTRAMADAMNAQMQKLDPDFAVLMGDLAYANDVNGTRWIDWLGSWTEHSVGKDRRVIPMVVAIGNHEVKKGYNGRIPQDAEYFYSLFSLPQDRSYYALDFGQYLSWIILDSGHTQPVDGLQAEWLQHALDERVDQRFLFAGYHFPAYGTTKGPEGGLPIDNPRATVIQKNWVPLFERYGLTAVFENDHHTFKRTHRIRAGKRDDANGILYLGDGSWGVVPREVPAPGQAWWLAKAEQRNHLWHVQLRSDGTATAEAVDPQGEAFDRVEWQTPRTKPAR
ncbi:MAG: metallophosphoesterase family protein [Pirellulales bacterium]|nr:metallophosphoesterase family protein [Pirellulales bacterium]